LSIDSYIAELQRIQKDLPATVIKTGYKYERYLIQNVQNRLYNQGIGGGRTKLGEYKAATKAKKILKGRKIDFVTLKNEGDWYKAMYIRDDGESLFIDSKNWKTAVLEARWGQDILQLTSPETTNYAAFIVEPAIQKLLNRLPNIEL